MGTLLNRRRYMGGVAAPPYDENSYIQDGLVFQLDGINKGSNQGYWTDLIGGIVYTNYGATSLLNGFQFNGSDSYLFHDDTLIFDDTNTLEIVFNRTASGTVSLFTTAGNDSSSFALAISSNNAVHSHRTSYRHAVGSGKMTFCVTNNTICYINGSIIAQGSRTNWNNPDGKSYIGRRSPYNGNSNYFTGDIYAIRIYNKVLTEEEILHNQAIDNIRFNLGLTI